MDSPFGSYGSRLGAFLVDAALCFGANLGGGLFGAVLAGALANPGARVQGQGFWLGWYFWGLSFAFINFCVLQGLTGSSIGKRVFGLKVVTEAGRTMGIPLAFGRNIVVGLSQALLYVGFLPILWSDKRQGVHDLICSTIVIREDADLSFLGITPSVILLPAPVAPFAATPDSGAGDQAEAA